MRNFPENPHEALEWIDEFIPELYKEVDSIRAIANEFGCSIFRIGLTSMILVAEANDQGTETMIANMVMINLDGLELYSFAREGNFDNKYYIVVGLNKYPLKI